MTSAVKRKTTQGPLLSIQLPKEEERELATEIASTGRTPASIITESLRIRRAVLEAAGVHTVGSEPEELPMILAKLIEAGLRRGVVRL